MEPGSFLSPLYNTDMFCPSKDEIALDEAAVEKQKALIDRIHSAGGEVLMSSHTFKSTTLEQNLMIAREQAARGADIIKIVKVNARELVDSFKG